MQPPGGGPALQPITTIDAHAAGEPLRVIVNGFPNLPGATILARPGSGSITCAAR
jgi:proline racemase